MKLFKILFKPYVFLVVIGLLTLAFFAKSQTGLFSEQPQLITYPVHRASVTPSVLATGILQATKHVDVGAQISGQLKHLYVDIGDNVVEGQLLAELDDTILKNSLLLAEANYNALLAKQRSAQAQFTQAVRNKQRYNSESVRASVSVKDIQDLGTTYQVKQAELDQVKQELLRAKVEVENAKKNLSFTKISSPLDGTVVETVTQVGQTVIATQQAPTILRVADLSNMTIEARISEVDIIKVKKGAKAYFSIFGEPSVIYKSYLDLIKPSPENRNSAIFYKAQLSIPNSEEKLRIDMTANVTIILEEAIDVLTVSRDLTVGDIPSGMFSAHVLNLNGEQVMRQIQLGLADRDRIEIVSGVNEGEAIILDKTLIAVLDGDSQYGT